MPWLLILSGVLALVIAVIPIMKRFGVIDTWVWLGAAWTVAIAPTLTATDQDFAILMALLTATIIYLPARFYGFRTRDLSTSGLIIGLVTCILLGAMPWLDIPGGIISAGLIGACVGVFWAIILANPLNTPRSGAEKFLDDIRQRRLTGMSAGGTGTVSIDRYTFRLSWSNDGKVPRWEVLNESDPRDPVEKDVL